ncbi:hypothetical protein NLM33_35675 [Bradyrhizobium sp. CCGUVB1N3]|nr:hypothetical protein [Bradyrhizobium sp. CCGUVB1N3]MCP3475616.1 hypothetical protein [Bradyrhizobium sp. CCGUVB1N3]
MARFQYFVTLHKGQWMVALNGEHFGPYATLNSNQSCDGTAVGDHRS